MSVSIIRPDRVGRLVEPTRQQSSRKFAEVAPGRFKIPQRQFETAQCAKAGDGEELVRSRLGNRQTLRADARELLDEAEVGFNERFHPAHPGSLMCLLRLLASSFRGDAVAEGEVPAAGRHST